MALTYKVDVFDGDIVLTSKKCSSSGKPQLHTSHILFTNKPYSKNGIWVAGRYVEKPKNVSKEDFETARNQLKLYLNNCRKEYHRKRYQAHKAEIKITNDKNKSSKKYKYEENKELFKERSKKWYNKQPKEERQKYNREYYHNNKDKILEYKKSNEAKLSRKQYRDTIKEKLCSKSRKWNIENSEHVKKYQKEYYEKNKEKIDKYNRVWYRKQVLLKGIKDT
tara:strand:+ start:34 stop:699 length:666 start_codon:yes stop_codon:yes gene_type:complete